jgi:hypothetical protein
MADTIDDGLHAPPGRLPGPATHGAGPLLTAVAGATEPPVSVRDLDILRTRLELLHDMNDRDRREREQHRRAVQAAVTEMQRQVGDVQRDHRAIRQTVGDLAAMVQRQSAEGSAVREAFDALRAAVVEVRDEGRAGLRQLQRDQRRAVEQLEAHAGMDRDRLGATAAAVERLGAALDAEAARRAASAAEVEQLTRMLEGVGVRAVDASLAVERVAEDVARQEQAARALRASFGQSSEALAQQQTTELEHVAILREQLAETIAVIEELGAATKRQAGQITRLRADLKKATTAPPDAAPAKRSAAKKASAKLAGQKGQAARRSS